MREAQQIEVVVHSLWWPPVLVAACALVFTVGSFWWINARRGVLQSWEPHSFAAAVLPSVLLIRLPLVLYNTGAKPIVVQDLRLAFPDEPSSVIPLPWRTSRKHLDPNQDDDPHLPAVFAVPGRTAGQYFIEFGCPLPGFPLELKDYRVRIEAELGHKRTWQSLLTVTLRVPHIAHPGNYIAYSNSPRHLTDEDRAKGEAALRSVMAKLAPPAR